MRDRTPHHRSRLLQTCREWLSSECFVRLCRRESAHSVSVSVGFSSARRERCCLFGRRRAFDWKKSLPFGLLLGGALVLSTPKRSAKISPREKLLVSWDRTRERKSPLFPSRSAPTRFFRRVFRRSPAGANLGRVDHRVFGLINLRARDDYARNHHHHHHHHHRVFL